MSGAVHRSGGFGGRTDRDGARPLKVVLGHLASSDEAAAWHLERWCAAKRRGEIAPARSARPRGRLRALRRASGRLARRALRRAGVEIQRAAEASDHADPPRTPYRERGEVGPCHFLEKLRRVEAGGPFEWPNLVALNSTLAAMVGSARDIVELGGGTGCFAHEAAAVPSRRVVCADPDKDAIDWARAHRSRANITYTDRVLGPAAGRFDLAVAVDVIEHLADFRAFLETCTALAPRLLITTTNRARGSEPPNAGPPSYYQHVREWTAGEFYWVLRCFYRQVHLYAMPDPLVPIAVPIDVNDAGTPLIADCTDRLAPPPEVERALLAWGAPEEDACP